MQDLRGILNVESDADLIVLSGDMVTGDADDGSIGWWAREFRKITDVLTAYQIPYASILGNHDAAGPHPSVQHRRKLVTLDQASSNLSLTQLGPEHITGASNYWLDILPSGLAQRVARNVSVPGEHQSEAGHSAQAAARIWMIDSTDGGCGPFKTLGWGCVRRDTLQWMVQQAQQLPPAPSLSFIHIPVPEFLSLWKHFPTVGNKLEKISCPFADFLHSSVAALRKAGITAVYSGHDHGNDFSGEFLHKSLRLESRHWLPHLGGSSRAGSMRLAYGRKTGCGGYQAPIDGFKTGARVIVLGEGDPTMSNAETYIRLGDGSKLVQEVTPADHKVSWEQFQLSCI